MTFKEGAMDDFQHEFGLWADKTFPQNTQRSIMQHFAREVVELVGVEEVEKALAHEKLKASTRITDCSVTNDIHRFNMEIADCLLLLMHLCHKRSVSLRDLAMTKAQLLRHRKWKEPDSEGVVEHAP